MMDSILLGKVNQHFIPSNTKPSFQAVLGIINPRMDDLTVAAGDMPAERFFLFYQEDRIKILTEPLGDCQPYNAGADNDGIKSIAVTHF